ncbi:MAG: hypothetical protein ACODAU_04470 [Myxococcota bacterium]
MRRAQREREQHFESLKIVKITMIAIGVISGGLVVLNTGLQTPMSWAMLWTIVAYCAFGIGRVIRDRKAALRALARLPWAADESACDSRQPGCAGCGAALAPDGEGITATCDSCGAQSLLPSSVIQDRLRKKHARAARLKKALAPVAEHDR